MSERMTPPAAEERSVEAIVASTVEAAVLTVLQTHDHRDANAIQLTPPPLPSANDQQEQRKQQETQQPNKRELERPPLPSKPEEPSGPTQSLRSKRMQQILKKALDVSVSSASAVNMHALFEKECKGDDALLQQLFANARPVRKGSSSSTGTVSTDGEGANREMQLASELSAQSLQHLRQFIQAAFAQLCDQHGMNERLLQLEAMIDDAQHAKMQQLATEQLDGARSQPPSASKRRKTAVSMLLGEHQPVTKEDHEMEEGKTEQNMEEEQEDSEDWTPAQVIRAERIRVMETEKKELERLVRHLRVRKHEKQAMLQLKREAAQSATQRLHVVAMQMDEASTMAADYAAAST